jgi:hypothetical protein
MRYTRQCGEADLETYARLQSPDAMPKSVLKRLVRGVSCRDYEPEFGITFWQRKRYSPQLVIGKDAKLERIPWIGKRCFVRWTTSAD